LYSVRFLDRVQILTHLTSMKLYILRVCIMYIVPLLFPCESRVVLKLYCTQFLIPCLSPDEVEAWTIVSISGCIFISNFLHGLLSIVSVPISTFYVPFPSSTQQSSISFQLYLAGLAESHVHVPHPSFIRPPSVLLYVPHPSFRFRFSWTSEPHYI